MGCHGAAGSLHHQGDRLVQRRKHEMQTTDPMHSGFKLVH